MKGRGGVEYEDLEIGHGPEVARGCQVTIRYDLLLNRGDAVQKQEVSTFCVGDRSTIAGLDYGVEGMRECGLRKIRFGPHLGYGNAGVPGMVPADALLEFHVKLLRVTPAKGPPKSWPAEDDR